MDEHHKYAYRTLLYYAMLDIRPLAWQPRRWHWLSPRFWPRFFRKTRYSGEVAEWFHNMAEFSRRDFVGFDESRFWNEFQHLAKRFPEVDYYRNIFDNSLTQSRTGKWPSIEEQAARDAKGSTRFQS